MEDEEIEYQYVVAQDPGETTGVAVLRYTENTKPELVFLHQIEDGREGFFHFFIGTEVGEGTNTVSVSEKFERREGVHGVNFEPLRIEGIQDAIWIFQTHYQSPSVKPIVGDEFLKVNNLWTEGKRHQMDALLHGIYYLRSIGHEPTLKSLSGDDTEPWEEEGGADAKTLPSPGGNGGEEEGSGEGNEGGQPGESAGAGSGDSFIEALKAMAAVAREAEKSGKEPTGSGGFAEGGYVSEETELSAKPKRSLNGAFIGFEDDD